MLVVNRFVPIDGVPGSAAVLRKFVRGGTGRLDAAEERTLREYRGELGKAMKWFSEAFAAGEPTPAIQEMAWRESTWPAVGVAASEEEMRELLVEQYVVLQQAGVARRDVDSSTYSFPKPDGIYVLVDWFWHG